MSLLKLTKTHNGDEQIVFIGASSVENWMYNGREVWANNYMPRHAYNYGVAGDRVENVLWRVENGEFENVKVKVVVLLVGKWEYAPRFGFTQLFAHTQVPTTDKTSRRT